LLVFTAPPIPSTYPLSLHDALPICVDQQERGRRRSQQGAIAPSLRVEQPGHRQEPEQDSKVGGQHRRSIAGKWKHQGTFAPVNRSEEHTSELQSHLNLVCRLLLEKK